MSNAKFKQYKALRQSYFNRLTELKEACDLAMGLPPQQTHMIQFDALFAGIREIKQQFSINHTEVIMHAATLEDASVDDEDIMCKNFNTMCAYIESTHYALFHTTQSRLTPSTDSNASTSSAPSPRVRLPKLEIRKFTGDIKTFKSFIDLYKTLIHDNLTLSDVEKFNYLASYLEGPPLALIQRLPMSSNNYQAAFTSLLERYDNPRLVAFAHLKELDDAPVISASNHNLHTTSKLIDTFQENVAALENLGFKTQDWDFILFYKLTRHLDEETLTQYEVTSNLTRSEMPTYNSLITFLTNQHKALETVKLSTTNKTSNREKSTPLPVGRIHRTFMAKPAVPKCGFCGADHHIFRCTGFNNKTPNERLNYAQANKWCTNCLSAQHRFRECRSQSVCKLCHAKHHTLLHLNPLTDSTTNMHSSVLPLQISDGHNMPQLQGERPTQPRPPTPPTVSNHSNFCGLASSTNSIILATAIVEMADSQGTYQKVRALIDTGSETNYITQKCARRLRLPRFRSPLTIQGLGNMQEITTHGGVTCSIKPVGKSGPIHTIDAFVLTKLCPDLPACRLERDRWPHLDNVSLADPNFHLAAPIDVLLGAEVFPQILKDGRIMGRSEDPVAINTTYGWILMGKFTRNTQQTAIATSLFSMPHNQKLNTLEQAIRQFWEVENTPSEIIPSKEDEQCERIYAQTHTRDATGRYEVDLPFRESDTVFEGSQSYAIASRRFYSLEKRLVDNNNLHSQYSTIIKQYLKDGYLEKIPDDDATTNCYYIPHHCVIKPEKLRIVYNASTKLANNLSLNDTLLTGAKLQRDIIAILLNFRTPRIVFTCDIKGMFTQIKVAPKHHNFQRILWRFSPSEPLGKYRLTRVTFGLSCSPFLANRTILQLAQDEGDKYPLAAQVLRRDIYVDDIVTGHNDVTQARIIRDEIIHLLEKGGFELSKWHSNDPELLQDLPSSGPQAKILNLDAEPEVTKILGLSWQAHSDSFCFKITEIPTRPCTKRTILSDIARVFDPLGYLTPVTSFTKCIMQSMWTLGLGWDGTPPANVQNVWNEYKTELSRLSELSIPRWIPITDRQDCQLHGFCDASQKAYAGVVYVRTNDNGVINTYLLIAKSRVAPLKSISIPRLELCAASLLSRLMEYVQKLYETRFKFSEIYAWSDSMIALAWIKSLPHRWKTFVGNRVANIQEKLPPECWHYVSSKNNPSDPASRGLLPTELLKCTLWWQGPSWLTNTQDSWPAEPILQEGTETSSERRVHTLLAQTSETLFTSTIDKHSALPKIQRIVSYVLRFMHNVRYPQERHTETHFNMHELHAALLAIVKQVQFVHFHEVIENLKCNKSIPKMFRKLAPFIDETGLLRVGGRLRHSLLPYDHKFPALLPQKDRITSMLIEHYHRIHLHPGVQTLQALITQHFWILSARSAIQSSVRKCIRCFRLNPHPYQPFMGELPRTRISQVKPFAVVALDYAGPLSITLGKTRGAKTYKAYICVFVCFATKALHLELASDLSCEAFLAALRRFIARRGRCSKLHSDCGTNFTAAQKYLSSIFKQAAEAEGMEWHFNPPASPHFNGLAEAGVKSVKTHLKRVIGEQILTYEELYTVLTQIEAMLNSRPLCPVSNDPTDLTALTPGHFLTLEPITSLPDKDISNIPLNRLTRWQLLQHIHQHFWKRWRDEYLHTLQQRSKWLTRDTDTTPQTGALVILKTDNAPPCQWPLGRILELYPGSDGIARVALVKTAQNTYKRPLVKICPLPTLEQ